MTPDSPASRPIYLDAHATTPVDPRVLEAMLPYFSEKFGNAASRAHPYGWEAADAVDEARERAAAAIGAEPKEIIWTSGATEADNLALLGAAEMATDECNGLVVSSIEHQAVLDCAAHLERRGVRVTIVGVGADGIVDPEEVANAADARTFLVSIMTANNEIGTLQPIEDIVRRVKARSSALVHTDAVQAIGRVPVDVRASGVDLLSMSAHKIYGPKGVGALFVRRRRPTVRLAPILHGGGHERGLRSGTLNVPGIVGFGVALEIAEREREAESARTRELRDRLRARLEGALDGIVINGHPTTRLPNNLNVSFARIDAEELLREMPEIAVSTGAACSSASLEPSHVIRALGLGEARAQSSIRFGLGRFTTREDIDTAASRVIAAVQKLRKEASSTSPSPSRESAHPSTNS